MNRDAASAQHASKQVGRIGMAQSSRAHCGHLFRPEPGLVLRPECLLVSLEANRHKRGVPSIHLMDTAFPPRTWDAAGTAICDAVPHN